MRTSVLLALSLCILILQGACSSEEPHPEPEEQEEEVPWNPEDGLQPQEGAPYSIESSGNLIEGEYVLENPNDTVLSGRYVFTAEGFYERTVVRVGGAATDYGSYLFDTSGHLVLYVERRGDYAFSSAEPESMQAELDGDVLLIDDELRFRKVVPPVGP